MYSATKHLHPLESLTRQPCFETVNQVSAEQFQSHIVYYVIITEMKCLQSCLQFTNSTMRWYGMFRQVWFGLYFCYVCQLSAGQGSGVCVCVVWSPR